jgi:hypothetical protein
MNGPRPIVLALLAIVSLSGCVSAAGGLATKAPVSDGPPIDTTIASVSASAPSSDWATFLDACGIVYSLPGHNGKGLGTGVVYGIGRVAHARDIVKYAPLGPAAEIQTDAQSWVLTTHGWFAATFSDAAIGVESLNPTCFAVGDPSSALWASTGGTRQGAVVQTPLPLPPATLRLPPLLP